jgi:hypothetical protein
VHDRRSGIGGGPRRGVGPHRGKLTPHGPDSFAGSIPARIHIQCADRTTHTTRNGWRGDRATTEITDPGSLDIGHLVPLRDAYLTGGWAWTTEKRREDANDLGAADHLVAVEAGTNRSKSWRSPALWKPLLESS